MKTATQFIQDISAGGDLLDKMVTAYVDKSKDFSQFLQDEGYDFDQQELEKALCQAEETAIGTWSGIYYFSEPASLQNYAVKILAKDSSVYVDQKDRIEQSQQKQQVQSEGNRCFGLSGQLGAFTLTFSENYDKEGQPLENEFSGTYIEDGEKPQNVKGKQVLPEETGAHNNFYLNELDVAMMLLGIPLLAKGFWDWGKECKEYFQNKKRVASPSAESHLLDRLITIQKNAIVHEAAEEITSPEKVRVLLDQNKELILDRLESDLKRAVEKTDKTDLNEMKQAVDVNDIYHKIVEHVMKQGFDQAINTVRDGYYKDISQQLELRNSIISTCNSRIWSQHTVTLLREIAGAYMEHSFYEKMARESQKVIMDTEQARNDLEQEIQRLQEKVNRQRADMSKMNPKTDAEKLDRLQKEISKAEQEIRNMNVEKSGEERKHQDARKEKEHMESEARNKQSEIERMRRRI